jgi:hypothetical protein
MTDSNPVTVICHYKVKPGKEAEMEALLAKHWPALREAGLVTDDPARIYKGLPSAKAGGRHGAERTYIEIYQWRDAKAPGIAHESPQIMAVWEPMGGCCEDMDFPHFAELTLVNA